MAIVINGSGTVTGLAVGGLPDGTVDAGTLATNSVDSAELIDGAVDDSHIGALAASKLTGTVATANIADNAITLAKMASGTDGNIISFDASGNPVAIATGSDGQVLTSTGAGSPPAFEASAVGGKVLQVVSHFINSAIALNSSSYASVISKAITPVKAGSKFVILTTLDAITKDAASNYIRGKLQRSGTGVSGGASFIGGANLWDHYGYYGFVSEATDIGTLTNVFHDNPSYTLGNTITYGVDARRFDGSGTITINKWGSGTTFIIIMEIGA